MDLIRNKNTALTPVCHSRLRPRLITERRCSRSPARVGPSTGQREGRLRPPFLFPFGTADRLGAFLRDLTQLAGCLRRSLTLPEGLVGNDVAMSVRSCMFAHAFLLAAAILFVCACLGAIVFLFDRHCGPAFGHYGCDIPTADTQREVDPVARLR